MMTVEQKQVYQVKRTLLLFKEEKLFTPILKHDYGSWIELCLT